VEKYWVRTWRPREYAYPLAWRWSPEFFIGRKPVIEFGRIPHPFYSDSSRNANKVNVRLRFTQTGICAPAPRTEFVVDHDCNAVRRALSTPLGLARALPHTAYRVPCAFAPRSSGSTCSCTLANSASRARSRARHATLSMASSSTASPRARSSHARATTSRRSRGASPPSTRRPSPAETSTARTQCTSTVDRVLVQR
jgi:hypothetical protein